MLRHTSFVFLIFGILSLLTLKSCFRNHQTSGFLGDQKPFFVLDRIKCRDQEMYEPENQLSKERNRNCSLEKKKKKKKTNKPAGDASRTQVRTFYCLPPLLFLFDLGVMLPVIPSVPCLEPPDPNASGTCASDVQICQVGKASSPSPSHDSSPPTVGTSSIELSTVVIDSLSSIPVEANQIVNYSDSTVSAVELVNNQSSALDSTPVSSTLPWASRFKASLRNLKKMSSPTFLDDGTPVVVAPASILLKTSELWKGHIVAHFHGLSPSPAKIFNDLNPIWGKFGNITVRPFSDTACFIFFPSIATREWVLEIGFWQAGNCSCSVYPWSPSGLLELEELQTAPTWAVLKNIPPQLYSLEGISVIASAIGEPLHTEKSRLDPTRIGDTKVKVEIKLDGVLPTTVVVRDVEGNSATVAVSYPRPPPKYLNCGRFGHLLSRCPKPLLKKAAFKPIVKEGTKEVTQKMVILNKEPSGDSKKYSTTDPSDKGSESIDGSVVPKVVTPPKKELIEVLKQDSTNPSVVKVSGCANLSQDSLAISHNSGESARASKQASAYAPVAKVLEPKSAVLFKKELNEGSKKDSNNSSLQKVSGQLSTGSVISTVTRSTFRGVSLAQRRKIGKVKDRKDVLPKCIKPEGDYDIPDSLATFTPKLSLGKKEKEDHRFQPSRAMLRADTRKKVLLADVDGLDSGPDLSILRLESFNSVGKSKAGKVSVLTRGSSSNRFSVL